MGRREEVLRMVNFPSGDPDRLSSKACVAPWLAPHLWVTRGKEGWAYLSVLREARRSSRSSCPICHRGIVQSKGCPAGGDPLRDSAPDQGVGVGGCAISSCPWSCTSVVRAS